MATVLTRTLWRDPYRRQLATQAAPFLLFEAVGVASLFLPPGPQSMSDALWAIALLALIPFLLFLPPKIIKGPASFLKPLTVTVMAVLVIKAAGGETAGAILILFAPLVWSAMYLRRWQAHVVLFVTIVLLFLMSSSGTELNSTIRWRRSILSALFGALLVFAIHQVRGRARSALSERDQTNKELRVATSQARRREEILTKMSQGVIITDARQPDNPITYASASVERLTGYCAREILGRNCRFLQGPETDRESAQAIGRAMKNGEDCLIEILNYRKDGTTFWNALGLTVIRDNEGHVTNFVGILSDVSERRQLEGRLLQSEKMEVVGTLSAGMAHDFNNSLLVIRGYNNLLARNLRDENLLELSEHVDDAVQQASELTHRLLAYSRFHDTHPVPTDLNHLVTETLQLWGRLLGGQIICQLDLEERMASVMIDQTQLEHALVNLITNARDAMDQGGTLTVRTCHQQNERLVFPPRVPEDLGEFVVIEISDTGVGMDQATVARIFTPFFTTKAYGTGLGLPTVEKVIRQAGGHVEVTSRVGEGTTFHLYLPVTPIAVVEEIAPDARGVDLEGDETVLVVEDLEPALQILAHALSERGYHVLDAPNGLRAIEVAGAHRGAIALLVTDVDMPHLGGAELARELLMKRPELKIVFVSGYPVSNLVYEPAFEGRSAFVAKPYDLDELLLKMRTLISHHRAPLAP
ncbi:MAG TPA: ATP-binding protein [Acidimicrobiales bacterium]|nr:ATP-binding protein [Acidimicrobiales bacterium]